MKRSRTIRLCLIGTTAGATLVGCGSRERNLGPPVSAENTYTNNQHVHGAGYYHAPYRAWYPYPYNQFMPNQGYYHGGQWSQAPHQSGITASKPTPDAARMAQTHQAASKSASSTARGGFGRSSGFVSS